MSQGQALRIPLQVGTSALVSLARASAFAIPGMILTGIGVVVSLVLARGFGLGGVWLSVSAVLLAPGIALLRFAWKHARRAHEGRPSDVVMDAQGFVVSGGPHDARAIAWTEIADVTLETPAKPKEGESDPVDDSDLKKLCLYLHSAALQSAASQGSGAQGGGSPERLVLAFAERAGEQRSIDDLAATLRAHRTGGPPEGPPPSKADDGPQLLSCAACGGTVAPSTAPAVACPHCNQQVSVPQAIQDRLRDAETLMARPDAIVAGLIDQPGAKWTGAMFAAAAFFMLTAWPVAIAVLAHNYQLHALSLQGTLFVCVFLAACILGGAALIRGQLVDRQALRLVTFEFAATPPPAAGEPSRCRACSAPLPESGRRVVIRCAYCQSANVLGIDLRREASAARQQGQSLEEALARRTSERRRWHGITVVALAAIAVAGFSLRHGLGHNAKTWPLEQRCSQGELEACIDLADQIGLHAGPDVPHDRRRAAELYDRGCEANRKRACEAGAELALDRLYAPGGRNEARAFHLNGRACDLGSGKACRQVAAQLEKGSLLGKVPQNVPHAMALYRRGCELGDAASCDRTR